MSFNASIESFIGQMHLMKVWIAVTFTNMLQNKKRSFTIIIFRKFLGIPVVFYVILLLAVCYWWVVSSILNQEDAALLAIPNLVPTETLQRSLMNQIPDLDAQMSEVCQVMDVAMVCGGSCPRTLLPMLKSLLYHRQNPLHIHFLVDDASHRALETICTTWQLPDVTFSFYNIEREKDRFTWSNTHYSGAYPLLKLLIPEVLPSSVKQVMVFDSDLTLLCDVSDLWRMFDKMNSSQIFGMVENESDWYLQKERWPAIGRGFNTGVVLLNLEKLKSIDWPVLWKATIEKHISTLQKISLGDQDVINAIVKERPEYLYEIDCQYNVQMSRNSLAKQNCYGIDVRIVKIVHWNFKLRCDVGLEDAPYFCSLQRHFAAVDGYLLRAKLHRCQPQPDLEPPTSPRPQAGEADGCEPFRRIQRVTLRTYVDYWGRSSMPADDFDVTLVLQLSMDRLQFLERLMRFWEGPISAAVYLTDYEVPQFESFVKGWSKDMSSRSNIHYHLVFRPNEEMPYPVNYLRNVAIEGAATPYLFLMDADFVPMAGLYGRLRDAVTLASPALTRTCLVVAAFETTRYKVEAPRRKGALLSKLRRGASGSVAPFRALEWPAGHRATNYTRWPAATEPYQVEWQADYEPYLVVHRSVPKYDIRFSGFGWNKVSHSVELRALGYRLLVLPDAFIVHAPHAPSQDITKFRASTHYRQCLSELKKEFLEELRKKYNVTLEEYSVT